MPTELLATAHFNTSSMNTMTSPNMPRKNANDLWAEAAEHLSDEEKSIINVSQDKLKVLAELHALAETSRDKCIQGRWKYTRKSGQTVILRDVFDKIIRCIDDFKQVGDTVVQFDPVHAALPWAGIRFILQIAVNARDGMGAVIDGMAEVAEIISIHVVLENLYSGRESMTGKELQRALIMLYSRILIYLSKVKQYLEKGSAKRILKSHESEFDPWLDMIRRAKDHVSVCTSLMDKHDNMDHNKTMQQALDVMNTPLLRMDDTLRHIQDNLQESKRREILVWISREPYIEHHKQTKHDVLAGTGQWLLSHWTSVVWKKGSASSILWLHGIPGSGKSKLVSIVIEDALRDFESGQSPRPVYFYCSRNGAEPDRSDPTKILASLARQLSSLEPGRPLLKPTVDLYKKKEIEEVMPGPLEIDESCSLIINLVDQYPLTIIVIDALDECDPGKRRDLLKALEIILQESSTLVKIFVSSRNDQDIVLRLQDCPNLEIMADKNSDDIAFFVQTEVERLVSEGDLLQYSDCQREMQVLIVDRVVEGAKGMFRWASIQLQYLCRFNLDADIRAKLGRNPPDLDTLYTELFEVISNKAGELEGKLFKNILSWILCAQQPLKAHVFLAAVSVYPGESGDAIPVSTELVLKICNNLVVFDAQLDIFRFAHLSVREFLEKSDDYTAMESNAVAAKACLRKLAVLTLNRETRRNTSSGRSFLQRRLSPTEDFSEYATIYWPLHCQLSSDHRIRGKLKDMFRDLILGGRNRHSTINLWISELLPACLNRPVSSRKYDYGLRRHSRDKPWVRLNDIITRPESVSAGVFFLASVFDFVEILQELKSDWLQMDGYVNSNNRNFLHVATGNGSYESLMVLLDGTRSMKVTEMIVIGAISNGSCGQKMLELILDRRGKEVPITEDVASAACCREGILRLLFDRRGNELPITAAVVKRAAYYRDGEGIFRLLFDRRGKEVPVTGEVVKAATENETNGEAILRLIWDTHPDLLKKLADSNCGVEKLTETLFRVHLKIGWVYFRH